MAQELAASAARHALNKARFREVTEREFATASPRHRPDAGRGGLGPASQPEMEPFLAKLAAEKAQH